MSFFNNLKVGNKIIIGYIIILILMMGMAAVLLFNLNNVTTSFTFLIEHDQPVLSNAHRLEKLILDMETGERGFLITGKDEFLEPYQKGVAEFDAMIEIENKLVSDNPSQVAVLEKIGHLHKEWIQKAAKPEIAKRREANKATVSAKHLQEVLKAGVGKGILDELRRLLDQLEANLTTKGDLASVILTVKIAKDMVDQETGQRGFIITGEDSFLEPYRNGQAQLTTDIAALRPRLTGDSDNLALLNQIELLAAKWTEKAAKPEIGARQEMNANPVTIADVSAMLQAETGKAILDAMRVQFDIFIQTENKLNAVRSEKAQQNVVQARALTIGLTLGSIIMGLLLGISISRGITRPLAKLTKMTNKMAVGDISQMVDVKSREEMSKITIRQDELGDIGRSYDALTHYFKVVIEDIVQVSQGLAAGHLRVTPQADYKGDFVQIKNALETALSDLLQVVEDIVQVSQGLAEGCQITAKAEYRGDFIQIKNALETASAKLAEATAQNAIQNWLKTGQTQLNQKISGEQDVIMLAKNIITFITTYLEAQVGVFYLLEGERGKEKISDSVYLKLIASYAYTGRKGIANEFKLGEGLIGQAAVEKQQIIVTEIPENYIQIQSGLGEAIPQQLIVMPFMYEKAVKGVIEIGSFHVFTETQLELLEQVMPNIGIAVNTAESRTKMQTLLQQQVHAQLT